MEASPAPATSAAPVEQSQAPAPAAAVSQTETNAAPAAAPESSVQAAPIKEKAPETVAPKSDWRETLRADLKDYATTKGFQDPAAVLESYINLEKLRGVPQERLLKIPDANDEKGWNEVYSKLGKPATPDGYGLVAPEGGDSAFTDWAKDTFHKLNFTEAQAKTLIDKFNEFNTKAQEQEKVQYEKTIQAQELNLRKEWGAAYHQNVANAQKAYAAFGLSDEAITALEKAVGLDGVMKFMSDIGAKIGEHAFVGGRSDGFGGERLTVDQARARIQALKKDREFTQKYLSGDVEARAKLSRLHEMAYPAD